MQKRLIVGLILCLLLVACNSEEEVAKKETEEQPVKQETQEAPEAPEAPAPKADSILKNDLDKVSYAIGMDMGVYFKGQPFEMNPEMLAKGITDMYAGEKTAMTKEEAGKVLMKFQQDQKVAAAAEAKRLADENMEKGKAFLAENKKKDGVVTLPSGLQYKVVKEGTGLPPKKNDKVTVHYTGKLMNGEVFDSSVERKEPVSFPVTGVIPGWTEALQLMKPGAKWELVIPSELAYGDRQVGKVISPNSVLVFEVELLAIDEPEIKEEAKKVEEKQEVKAEKPAEENKADESKTD